RLDGMSGPNQKRARRPRGGRGSKKADTRGPRRGISAEGIATRRGITRLPPDRDAGAYGAKSAAFAVGLKFESSTLQRRVSCEPFTLRVERGTSFGKPLPDSLRPSEARVASGSPCCALPRAPHWACGMSSLSIFLP